MGSVVRIRRRGDGGNGVALPATASSPGRATSRPRAQAAPLGLVVPLEGCRVTAAADLHDGLWAAQWAAWEVILEGRHGHWTATLTLLPEHRQMERAVALVTQSDFMSATDAAKWAAQQMKDRGQIVLLLSNDGRPPKTLVDMLSFEPVVS